MTAVAVITIIFTNTSMKKILLFALLLGTAVIVSFGQSPAAWQSKVSPEIRTALDRGEKADFIVIFRDHSDLSGARLLKTKSEKNRYVYNRLVETAARSQANATRIVREQQVFANRLYLVNALAVEKADASIARQLAELPEVAWLGADPWIKFDGPVQTSGDTPSGRSTVEWGVDKINAPAVWALGYTGQGVTVGGADTGYEWWHPAIKTHYRGWTGDSLTTSHQYNWHDAIHELNPLNGDTTANPFNNPCGLDAQAPCDDNNHGTHTMGTMTGDDGFGNQIGVAPGAKWVGCRNMERGWGKPSSYLECFEWFLAPTDLNGDNPNPAKSPDVINNSWYCATFEGCTDLSINELLRIAVINMKAAGIVVVAAAGNYGVNPATGQAGYAGLTSPGNAPSVLTIGAREDFTRLSFLFQHGATVLPFRKGDTVELKFSKAVDVNLAQLHILPPKFVKDAEKINKPGQPLIVKLTLEPDVQVRSFVEGPRAVVDILPPDPKVLAARKLAPPPPPPKPPEIDPAPAGNIVRVQMVEGGSATTFTTRWGRPARAAAFRRGEAIYILFDSKAKLDLSGVVRVSKRTQDVQPVTGDGVTGIRIAAAPEVLVSAAADGNTWTFTLSNSAAPTPKPIAILRENGPDGGAARLIADFGRPGGVVRWIDDPEIGDRFAAALRR